MKKSLLLLLFIVVAVCPSFAQVGLLPPHYPAKPGDDLSAVRIVAVNEIQDAGETYYWALVELHQTLSPQAKDNGPNVTKFNLGAGALDGVAVENWGIASYYPSLTYYHPGDASGWFKSYKHSAGGKSLIWCVASRSGDYLTINSYQTILTHISYTYKKGFLGLGRGFGTYIVKIPAQLNLTQKWY
ncbi:hypothetical protein H8B06_15455 [Sphingobacterium sp. DN00404]|uniref:Uncharacterized protein n=2 Tax=Sphingobacterium micropteri TaxID=2763501 RepID=A0ABR7YSD7_9SPHI|nr:hypothetical protein [Sphingobacterium micropteri]